ncbi:hypothetical protein ACIRPK_15245 [Kitasatospora sp. NPDC101801]|uniref:hypothetical protein n=1 Tax=Kitasatospora sp. NPDC101801 TaxID=3364103 RepID=UPI003823FE76
MEPDPAARFWDGEFTLQAAAPAAAGEPPTAGLGPAGIRIGGRDLSVLLAETYRRLADPDGSVG